MFCQDNAYKQKPTGFIRGSMSRKCEFFHQPMEEDWGFAYCRRCKKIKQNLIIEIHQGFFGSDYIQVICPKCKKVMWVAGLSVEGNTFCIITNKQSIPKFLHPFCFSHTCKKPTNVYDCISYSFDKKGKAKCICSEKCERKGKNEI